MRTFLGLTFIFACAASLPLAGQTNSAPTNSQPPHSQDASGGITIRGGAWVTRPGGSSDILRGIELYICPEDIGDEVKASYSRTWSAAEKEWGPLTAYTRNNNAPIVSVFASLVNTYTTVLKTETSTKGMSEGLKQFAAEKAGGPKQRNKYQLTIVKTDIDGKYEFKDVAPGKYYIYAPLQLSGAAGFWLVPVTVDGKSDQKIDLDNSNLFDAFQ